MSELELSKKYRDICPDAVRRIYAREISNRRDAKEAEKATRMALHQMSGAFMTPDQLKRARALMHTYSTGDQAALNAALQLHASTRERMDIAAQLYGAIFERCGQPKTILDLACGLNPIYLGAQGHSVRALDVHGGATALINDWATACGWDVTAQCADLLSAPDLPACDIGLLFKLLPVMEQQQKGSAMRLLAHVPTPYKAVSFPTRTLGGRGVGMERHYSEWFEAQLPVSHRIVGRFLFPGELCYVVKEVVACPDCTSLRRPSET